MEAVDLTVNSLFFSLQFSTWGCRRRLHEALIKSLTTYIVSSYLRKMLNQLFSVYLLLQRISIDQTAFSEEPLWAARASEEEGLACWAEHLPMGEEAAAQAYPVFGNERHLTSLENLDQECRWRMVVLVVGGYCLLRVRGQASVEPEYFSFLFCFLTSCSFWTKEITECLYPPPFHSELFHFLVLLPMLFTLHGMPFLAWKTLSIPGFSSHVTSSVKPFWPSWGHSLVHRQYLFLCSHCSL